MKQEEFVDSLEDMEHLLPHLLNAFNRRFRPDAADLSRERAERCLAVEIEVERMTRRQQLDRRRTYGHADF